MTERFVIRPDGEGFTVKDALTGQTAVIASTPQARLSEPDAQHTADLLNRRESEAERAAAQ